MRASGLLPASPSADSDVQEAQEPYGRRVSRLVAVLVLPLLLVPVLVAPSSSAAGPQHVVAVSGAGAATYPAFTSDISRYAITTTEDTGGSVNVQVSTSDTEGRVLVNGRAADGPTTVTGLTQGDEISIIIEDDAGVSAYSYIYLPPGFPALQRVPAEAPGGPSPGLVMLTLGLWTEPSPFFEAAVDANGVPAYVRSTVNSMDLRRQPNGNYSVARGTGGADGAAVVELDDQFREVARHRTVGRLHTDGHDSILLSDGTAYLLGYEPNAETGKTDAIVQHVAADGTLLFEWNSKDHVDIPTETVVGSKADYAHVNSIDLMEDGDLLVSFRHLSSVFKIARHAHDGHAEGEVVWRLGGRASDFAFVDELGGPSDGGPCAQHTATALPDGKVMVFDNGAWNQNPLCPDPVNIAGDPVARTPSRVAVWELDETAGVATLVRDQRVDNRYAVFAGSAQPLTNGNVVVGWAAARDAVASELDAQGRVVWEVRAVDDPKYFSYRAFKAEVPDAIAPEINIESPAAGASYELGERVRPEFSCTDRGGSNLHSCAAGTIDTSLTGTHTVSVTAGDGAGNDTVIQRTYTVTRPPYQPDAAIRLASKRRWIGKLELGARPRQIVDSTIRRPRGRSTAVVLVRNVGKRADRFRVASRVSSRAMGVRLILPEARSTSPLLSPGEAWRFRVRVQRRAATVDGTQVTARVAVRSRRDTERADVVWFRVRAR